MQKYRIETDFLGEKEIPADAYYGINAVRGRENFDISGEIADSALIKMMAWVKKACALANMDCGNMEKDTALTIASACDKLADGGYDDQFIVNPIQGGGGTSFNMNANEVLANIVLEMMSREKGEYDIVGPLTHINMSQSTNDVFPTALNLALIQRIDGLCDILLETVDILEAKSHEVQSIMKMGRTHLNAAAPISFAQSYNAYALALVRDHDRIQTAAKYLSIVPLGGTVIGTEYKASPQYCGVVINHLREIAKADVRPCLNLADGIQNTDDYSALSGTLKTCALNFSKIASDFRLLGSDRNYGIGDLTLSPRQLGSSIIDNKVNPVIAELINQVAFLVCGYDLSISMAAGAGQLELNVFKPVISYALFKSIDYMANSIQKFNEYCIGAEIKHHPR